VTTADGPLRIAVGRLIRSNSANAYAHHMLPTAAVMISATLVLNRLIAVPRGEKVRHLHRAVGAPRRDARMTYVLVDRHDRPFGDGYGRIEDSPLAARAPLG